MPAFERSDTKNFGNIVRKGAATPTPASAAPTITDVPSMTDQLAALDWSALPTSDPGNGQLWLKLGNLHVGV